MGPDHVLDRFVGARVGWYVNSEGVRQKRRDSTNSTHSVFLTPIVCFACEWHSISPTLPDIATGKAWKSALRVESGTAVKAQTCVRLHACKDA